MFLNIDSIYNYKTSLVAMVTYKYKCWWRFHAEF